jgi:aspartate-semialdehyde dehydrogenase
MERLKVAVLGAGGLVAQRLQQRLSNHPWFELAAVAGSPRFQDLALGDVPWALDEQRPELPALKVLDVSSADTVSDLVENGVVMAFSSLPREQAAQLEPLWVKGGITVFSNASAFRGVDGVPLVIPEVNPAALDDGGKGLNHACATNCTLLPLILPLAALHETYGLQQFTMRSEQGLSGGGHAYMLTALQTGDVSPEIPGEAEKTEAEFRHILGWQGEASLTCQRVMRADGHHVFVEATFERPVNVENVRKALESWSKNHTMAELPSGPKQPLAVVDRIQPAAHLFADGEGFPVKPDLANDLAAGMAVVVGNFRCPSSTTVCFEAYSHNTVRGAAGGVVFLAELAHWKGLVSTKPVHP